MLLGDLNGAPVQIWGATRPPPGGRREGSEWQRSADDEAAQSARKMPGTATG